MGTIFPREEKAEQIFDEILKNPRACDRLKNTFFAAIPSAEESEGAGTDIPGTVFAAALFNAYENKDLSAFMMAVCNNSVFDLLRNSFLIPIRFNDKGVENPILLRKNTKCSANYLNSRTKSRIIRCIWRTVSGRIISIAMRVRSRQERFPNTEESF